MSYAPAYLLHRFFFRIIGFFHHWYIDASRWFLHGLNGIFMNLEQSFALCVTFRHFFEPLYKDYSIVGRILGVIFRSGRIVIGLLVYGIVTVLFMAVYIAWLSLPLLLLFAAFRYFPS